MNPLVCSGKVGSSCFISDARYVTIKNQVLEKINSVNYRIFELYHIPFKTLYMYWKLSFRGILAPISLSLRGLWW